MKAARVLRFGPPGVIINDDLPRPEPAAGQLLVRVKAAGVGNWDALVREGKIPNEPLPLILGYELSGIVEAIGPSVSGFTSGDEVYGATSEQLTGAYAEYSVPSAKMMAQKPKSLNFIEAASAPVVMRAGPRSRLVPVAPREAIPSVRRSVCGRVCPL